MDYGLELLANRCATFSKYGSPPECYSKVLSAPGPDSINAMKLMKADWLCLQGVECSGVPKASMLAADLRLTFDPCVRYTALQFQSHGWRVSYQAGRDLLQFLTATFPESKIVEACHQLLRTATGPKANQKLSGTCVQCTAAADKLRHTGVSGHGSPCQIDQRQIPQVLAQGQG